MFVYLWWSAEDKRGSIGEEWLLDSRYLLSDGECA